MSRLEVQHTQDFDRILALPRRVLTQRDAEAWAEVLTEEFRARGGTRRLRPWQGMAIAECVENNGGLLGLPVGFGKTDLTWLLPVAMGAERSLLIVPANLREKTWSDFGALRSQWRSPNPPPKIISREELSIPKNARLIKDYRPTLIMIDEGDEFSNRTRGAARRIDREVVERQDEIAVVVMTGTLSRNSIMGYWHLLMWTLRERAPVPLTEHEAVLWDAAISEGGRYGADTRRPHPGPLGQSVTSARAWFAKRLRETPGVVIVDGDSAADVPLTIRIVLAKECPKIDHAFKQFNNQKHPENPAGMPVTDPLSRWKMDGFLGCGYYQEYVTPPPEDWREARRELAQVVRDTILASSHTSRPIDTESQAIARLEKMGSVELAEWLRVKSTFDPKTRVCWLSRATIESCLEWLKFVGEPAIVWCGGVEFATELAKAARLDYYGREGKCARGVGLHAADTSRSMVVSWNANKKGFNLQAWRRQLIVHPPQSAKWLEQIFGRSHRAGQTLPVIVDILATSGGTLDAFAAARAEARFARATVSMTQKILRAEIIVEAMPRITPSNKYRWARKEK